MEKNVMRSMELVGRERMEVAVSTNRARAQSSKRLTFDSNNCPSGARHVMMMSLM